jgi:flagellar biosynthesis chaperone FliJ
MLEQGAQIIQKREKERNQFHDTLNLNFNLSFFSLNPFIVFLNRIVNQKIQTLMHTPRVLPSLLLHTRLAL